MEKGFVSRWGKTQIPSTWPLGLARQRQRSRHVAGLAGRASLALDAMDDTTAR